MKFIDGIHIFKFKVMFTNALGISASFMKQEVSLIMQVFNKI